MCCFNIFGKHLVFLILVPWKRYYETRNRVLIAASKGILAKLSIVPSSMLRLILAVLLQDEKIGQVGAILSGLADGFRNRKGVHRTYRPKL